MKKLFLNNKPLHLDPGDLIQSGGEGMVFGKGQMAVKIYHRPQPGQAEKLNHLMSSRIAGQLPDNVLAPCQLVLDENQRLAGLAMPRLPLDSQNIRQLSNLKFYQLHGFDTRPVILLIQEIHQTLGQLHQLGVIVGDLNDHNLQFTMPAGIPWLSFWIDIDSYQVGSYPCPVATQSFLDPFLYDIQDFSAQPSFTESTDWYAFFVVLVKSLLLAHPYGGTHPKHKSLTARAKAGISILNPSVTYPRLARPLECLSDDLLHHIELTFEKGQRRPFPSRLLTDYAAKLHQCTQCGLVYPNSRPGCPDCSKITPVVVPTIIRGRLQVQRLVEVEGYILEVNVQLDGRIQAITRTGNDFHLLDIWPGRRLRELNLFSGQQSYRFAFFGHHYLVVNPIRSRQLLLLDTNHQPIQQLDLIETSTFREKAVFTCSQHYLYRQIQGLIMRGEIRDGLYVEENIATARQGQTWLWATSQGDWVSGYYRFFDEYHFFSISENGTYHQLDSPFLASGDSLQEIEGLFGREEVGFLVKVNQHGHLFIQAALYDDKGQLSHSFRLNATEADLAAELSGRALFGTTVLWATDEGVIKHKHNGQSKLADTAGFTAQGDQLHYHPAGLLVQQASALYLVSESNV